MSLVNTIWEPADRRENRHVLVERADHRYAYVVNCNPDGTPIRAGRPRRVLLNGRSDRLQGYRQVETGGQP